MEKHCRTDNQYENSCTPGEYLSKSRCFFFTKIRSTIKDGLVRYCNTKISRNGVNNMWILINSTSLLSSLDQLDVRTATSVQAFDFSTLYTPIPHDLTTLFTNFLSLFILLLIPFTLLCLTDNVDFNVELRDCKQSFLYHKRNLYITNIFNYTRLNFNVFNNNVSNIIHPLPISGIAYKLDGDFPSKNFTHKIHYKSGPEAHTIKLVFFPLLFLFIVTISNWIRKETFCYYTSIKHKYLFLKSRRHFRKHGTLFVFQKYSYFSLLCLHLMQSCRQEPKMI